MGLSNKYQRVALGLIDIRRETRQRRVVDTKGLKDSIAKLGVLQPIIVVAKGDGRFELVAGERRFQSSFELGLPDIPARLSNDLSNIELQIIELEENLKREDLQWQDSVDAVVRIHRLYQSLDPAWTQGETADSLSLTQGTISMYLRVGSALAEERVAKAGTVREALNLLDRRDQRLAGQALEDLLDTADVVGDLAVTGRATAPDDPADPSIPGQIPPAMPRHYAPPDPIRIRPPAETILHQSFLDWAPTYSGPKFNLVHCDFPYGVDLFNGPQGRGAEPSQGYTDTKDTYIKLLECFCENLDKFMSLSGHLMFWYSAKHHKVTMEIFRELAPTLGFHPFPLIWVKSDNAGISSDPRHGPRHVYETALLATRGGRNIVRVVADAYSAPTNKTLHPSTKPEPMLRHFMEMLVDEHSLVLDPTCGSGASLRAAESLGAKLTLGLEIDQGYVEPARQALKTSRLLREGSRVA